MQLNIDDIRVLEKLEVNDNFCHWKPLDSSQEEIMSIIPKLIKGTVTVKSAVLYAISDQDLELPIMKKLQSIVFNILSSLKLIQEDSIEADRSFGQLVTKSIATFSELNRLITKELIIRHKKSYTEEKHNRLLEAYGPLVEVLQDDPCYSTYLD